MNFMSIFLLAGFTLLPNVFASNDLEDAQMTEEIEQLRSDELKSTKKEEARLEDQLRSDIQSSKLRSVRLNKKNKSMAQTIGQQLKTIKKLELRRANLDKARSRIEKKLNSLRLEHEALNRKENLTRSFLETTRARMKISETDLLSIKRENKKLTKKIALNQVRTKRHALKNTMLQKRIQKEKRIRNDLLEQGRTAAYVVKQRHH